MDKLTAMTEEEYLEQLKKITCETINANEISCKIMTW